MQPVEDIDDDRPATATGTPATMSLEGRSAVADGLLRVGRYLIVEKLGAGGMGVVYSAYDPELDRRIAIKLLRLRPGRPAGRGTERLLREAQAMARLSHPNVIAVHDVGPVDDGVFFAMERVDGGTLRDWLKQPHGWREVLAVFTQAGRGLAAAHAVGIVHRDFKPENVLLGKDGRVRVTDFGIARALEAAEEVGDPGRGEAGSAGAAVDTGRPGHGDAGIPGPGAAGRTGELPDRPVQLLRGALRGADRRAPFQGRSRSTPTPMPCARRA